MKSYSYEQTSLTKGKAFLLLLLAMLLVLLFSFSGSTDSETGKDDSVLTRLDLMQKIDVP